MSAIQLGALDKTALDKRQSTLYIPITAGLTKSSTRTTRTQNRGRKALVLLCIDVKTPRVIESYTEKNAVLTSLTTHKIELIRVTEYINYICR